MYVQEERATPLRRRNMNLDVVPNRLLHDSFLGLQARGLLASRDENGSGDEADVFATIPFLSG